MELSGKTYSCAAGESFDSIARKLYGKEKYAAELLCVNPENCRKTYFTGGEILYLPEITLPGENERGLPEKAPWREE